MLESAEDRNRGRVKGSAAVPSRPRIALARGMEWAAELLAPAADVTVLAEAESEAVFAALGRHFPGGGPDVAVFAAWDGLGTVTVQAVRAGHPAVRRTATVVSASETRPLAPTAREAQAREAVARAGADRVLDLAALASAGPGALRSALLDLAGADRPAPAPPLEVGVLVVARPGGSFAETLGGLEGQVAEGAEVGVIAPEPGSRRAAIAAGARVLGPGELPAGDAVLVLDAGARPGRGLLGALGRALAADPAVVYATSWARAADPWVARPLGLTPLLAEEDSGGAALALRRDEIADHLADLVDGHRGAAPWLVARRLLATGHRAAVVPEELLEEAWPPRPARTTAARRAELAAARAPSPPHPSAAPLPPPHARPRVSVLMAAYQAEATLAVAIESALAQSEERLEVIVIDDGSAVPAAGVVARLHDPRLRVLRHGRNRGLSAARNTGLAAARAPLVAQLDADDAWHPDYLATLLPCLEDPGVALAYCNTWITGNPHGVDTYIPDASIHPMDRFPKIAEANPVPSLTALMRADAVRGVGGYATFLRHAMDYHLYAKLVAAGWRFAYVDERLAYYRWPEAARGMSFDTRRTEIEELKMWLAFVARHPRTPGPRRQVRVRARREAERIRRALRRG